MLLMRFQNSIITPFASFLLLPNDYLSSSTVVVEIRYGSIKCDVSIAARSPPPRPPVTHCGRPVSVRPELHRRDRPRRSSTWRTRTVVRDTDPPVLQVSAVQSGWLGRGGGLTVDEESITFLTWSLVFSILYSIPNRNVPRLTSPRSVAIGAYLVLSGQRCLFVVT